MVVVLIVSGFHMNINIGYSRVGQFLVVVIAFVTIMVMFFQTLWSSSDVLILRLTAASPQNLVHTVNRPKFLGAAWQRPQLNIFECGLLIEVYGDRGVGEFEVMVCSSLPVGKEKRKIKSLAGAIYHMFSGVTCSLRMIMSIPWSSPPFVTLGASRNLSSNTSTVLVERRTFKSKSNRGVRGLLNVKEWRKWGDDVNAIIIGRLNDSLRPSVLYKPTVAAAPFRSINCKGRPNGLQGFKFRASVTKVQCNRFPS
ncbi:hypothetical protein F2Q70_00025209 [Brassica cretica]|uniref:Uncharacterized protein n=1 Tax=Brassica cretica TaxID=69181 RepID=A0A8S9L8J9_BRACR|nr:hypothetical protein F2Q70_00025209 [Brassica cretica]